jgi:hypothetical protein
MLFADRSQEREHALLRGNFLSEPAGATQEWKWRNVL